MNEKTKELAEQAELVWSERNGWWIAYDDSKDLERFAELVRQDERDKCAQLLDDFAKTEMVPVKDTWRMGVMAAAEIGKGMK